MATSNANRPTPVWLHRREPVLAVFGAAAVLSAQLLSSVGGVWLLLDAAGGIAAVAAVVMLLRLNAARLGRPSLQDLANGMLGIVISGVAFILGRRGPESSLIAVPLVLIAAFGVLLSIFVLIPAVRDFARERSGRASAPADPARAPAAHGERLVAVITVTAAVIAVAAATVDTWTR